MIDNTANKKPKNVFIEGAISPEKIASSIAHHQVKTNIGAHDIFLGQVRADRINNETVRAIHYSCYEEMANEEFHQIREEAFSQFDLTCMHIYHSIGHVNAGEICLFVFTSSKHRKEAMDACRFLVEEIKKRVPIFGKELLADGKHVWKMNTPEDNK
ncbi:molybdenum cofactor biosynthesis protein MoaE [Flavobacteriales bacterium]|nr:molybdenum cofactor biosynthesis protein MoaE [Flavobacteriales bacterium]